MSFLRCGTMVTVLLGACWSAPLLAAQFTVTTTADELDTQAGDGVCLTASGGCSLRAAIQEANALPGADEITLAAGIYNLTLRGLGEDAARSGDLDIVPGSEIIIQGAAADAVIIDGQRADRVFQLHPGAALTLDSVTVRNGQVGQASAGGGIDNLEGHLVINGSRISGNSAFGQGGGVNNFRGRLEINRSVLSGNLALSTGGAIMNQDGDVSINFSTIRDNYVSDALIPTFGGGIYNSALLNTLEINNSTISGHRAFLDGGGIYHLIGSLRISNTTLSGNQAVRYGGGLFYSSGNSSFGMPADGNRLINVTVTANIAFAIDSTDDTPAPGGGGIYVRGANPLQLANSIVAGNARGGDCSIGGVLRSLGGNLDGDGSCGLMDDAASIAAGNAGLGVLADNGGPTLTHALLANSQALDAGDNGLCAAVDQRGFERVDGACDSGAVEAGALSPVMVQSAPPAQQPESQPNSRPEALAALLTVAAGGSAEATVAHDADGDPLRIEVLEQPAQGSAGQRAGGAGVLVYSAAADAVGSDRFTFRACDDEICSEPAIVNISISNEPVSSDIVINVAGDDVAGMRITLPDIDYSQPLGVLRFDLEQVPTDPEAVLAGTPVIIQLPAEVEIPDDAVVRKLNINQVWETLGSGPDPLLSTATIDRDNRRILLTLRDNDRFDHNRALGAITDPVALAVPRSTDGAAPAPVTAPAGSGAAPMAAGDDVAGSGALHPLLLLGLLLAGCWRHRR